MESEKDQVLKTAFHEEGHVAVAKAFGGVVHKRTVVPEGRSLGHAVLSFLNFSPEDRVLYTMTALCGGWVAEEVTGEMDHRGCGSDMAHLDHLANMMSKVLYEGRVAAEHFKAKAFSLARAAMPSFSILHHRALRLKEQGTII